MAHNLNPFDFVPFPNDLPDVKTVREWQNSGPLVTGWIELHITALTPLHIVGKQKADSSGQKISRSHFYRQRGQAFIPGSSLRGMLRAFIEAACNGWASQLTPYYKKERKHHQIGFQVLDAEQELKKKNDWNRIDPEFRYKFALPKGFAMPQNLTEEQARELKIDLASFLFGYIPPKGDGFRGRIAIEDAPVSRLSFNNDTYRIPDIQSDAFMGGGKPSAASWWYQKPYQIRLGQRSIIFVGSGYRGRKFYYHQEPGRCVAWYFNPNNWPSDSKRLLYPVTIECLPAEESSNPFRIYFEDLPEPFLHLLLFALSPGKRLRHKLGYGKPYGYGTIEITVTGGEQRMPGYGGKTKLEVGKIQSGIQAALWDEKKLQNPGVGNYLHWPSLEALARILWYARQSDLIFTYPPFNPKFPGFLPAIKREDLEAVLSQSQNELLQSERKIGVTENEGRNIAAELAKIGKRPALHFEVYQRQAQGYNTIQLRTLQVAETDKGDTL